MNMLKSLNAAIDYIEANLCAEPDLDTAAGIACITTDSFLRFFSYITGMTLAEYIRCRRLTLAAQDLRHGSSPIIDLAVKYGYDSASSFSRAFAKQHGISPSAYRKSGGSIKVYSPASFHIIVKGAKEMDFRIMELEETVVHGLSRPYANQGYNSPEELRHLMWAEQEDNIPGQLCTGSWNQPGSTSYDGVWYGIWQNGAYMIARTPDMVHAESCETALLPAGTYAAFRTGRGALAWKEFPKLFEEIFSSWLPASEYRQRFDLAIEVYHLWTDHDLRNRNRYYEVWIPVELKK